jgi:uncharacterized FlaG/YvyC family protein
LLAIKKIIKDSEKLIGKLKRVKASDEFEKLFIENSVSNLESQREYFNFYLDKEKDINKLIEKVYDKDSGKLFTNIEPKTAINDVELCSDESGLIFVP